MKSKHILPVVVFITLSFVFVILAFSSANATKVETADKAMGVVDKAAAVDVTSTATLAPEGPPFPRIYMAVHNNMESETPSDISCTKALYENDSWDTLLSLANIVEMLSDYGNKWKVSTNGDNDCNDPEDKYVVPWLEEAANNLGTNQGLAIPRKQIAFRYGWYYHTTLNRDSAKTHRDEIVPACVDEWPLYTVATPVATREPSIWKASSVEGTDPLAGLNVMTSEVSGQGFTNNCSVSDKDLFVDWYPDWLRKNKNEDDPLGAVDEWDGFRFDLPANMHGQFLLPPDMNLNGCPDVWEMEDEPGEPGKFCNSDHEEDTDHGNTTFNDNYRDGIQHMFSQLHAPPYEDWLIFGNNAWWPKKGSWDDPDHPSYASKPDINGTWVEDWTENWWGEDTSKPFSYSGWDSPKAVPVGQSSWRSVNFATSMLTLKRWQDAGKQLIVSGKWCNKPEVGIDNDEGFLENECGVDNSGNNIVDQPEWDVGRKYREVRFTMAAATLLGEYHNYIPIENNFIPYWFDEYAVVRTPDPNAPPYKAATTKEEKEEGVGWLGWPTAPPGKADNEMWALYYGTQDNDGKPEKTLTTALAEPNFQTRNDYINNRAWIRFFDHGVVLLNPTDYNREVNLGVDYYYRILGNQTEFGNMHSLYEPGEDVGYGDGYAVNNGLQISDRFWLPPHEGLFLVKNQERLVAPVQEQRQHHDVLTTICNCTECCPTDPCFTTDLKCDFSGCADGDENCQNCGIDDDCDYYMCDDSEKVCLTCTIEPFSDQVLGSGDGVFEVGIVEADRHGVTLAFNLSNLPPGAEIELMRLTVYIESLAGSPVIDITSNSTITETVEWSPQTASTWASSPDIKSLIPTPIPASFTLQLQGAQHDAYHRIVFRSSYYGDDTGNGSYAPRLFIAYRVPPPQ